MAENEAMEYVPTLTLDPDRESSTAVAIPAANALELSKDEPAAAKLDISQLSEEEQKQVRDFADKIDITDKIFKKLLVEPKTYTQVKRFADLFLPTSVKLLGTYERFGQSGVTGENITGTMERIDTALDMTLTSYKKFYDSLFENQALDIETDITVLETMLKKEGLVPSEFQSTSE